MDYWRTGARLSYWREYGTVDPDDGCAPTDRPFPFSGSTGGHPGGDFRILSARRVTRQGADDSHWLRGAHWRPDVYGKPDGGRQAPGDSSGSPHHLQGAKHVQY